MLRDGGNFVAKFFKSSDLSYLYVMMKQIFKNVYVVKPQSSRASSAEAFVIGIGFIENSIMGVMSDSIKTLKGIDQAPIEDKIIQDGIINDDEEEEDKLTF